MIITNERVYFQVIADSGAGATNIGSAGLPIILYGVNIEGGGSGTTTNIQSGQAAGPATDNMQLNVVASGTYRTDIFGKGIVFPVGCDIGTNTTTRLTVFYTVL